MGSEEVFNAVAIRDTLVVGGATNVTGTLTMYDSTGADTLALSHDGTNANIAVNAGTLNIPGLSGKYALTIATTGTAGGTGGINMDSKTVCIYAQNTNAGSTGGVISLGATNTSNPHITTLTANQDLRLWPNGSGVLSFGTKTGTGDAVSNGYISIKDAAGNAVKLMVTA